MAYSLSVSTAAENDLLEAYLWYEQQQLGLGSKFLEQVEKSYYSLLLNPEAFEIRYKKRVGAIPVRKFPYLVFYVLEDQHVKIISVFNTNRSTKILKKRIN
jgi:plasmid stabilization system protein ParE